MEPQAAAVVPVPEALAGELAPLPAAAPVPSADAPAARGLLEQLLDAAQARGTTPSLLERFLREPTPARALMHWLGPGLAAGRKDLRRHITDQLSRDIAYIDGVLNRQVNAILHHPRFQHLEASWRGLRYLVSQVPA